jgi:hypothetical protein
MGPTQLENEPFVGITIRKPYLLGSNDGTGMGMPFLAVSITAMPPVCIGY